MWGAVLLVQFGSVKTKTPSEPRVRAACAGRFKGLGAVALLELFAAAAWARVVTANVLQGVAHGLLVSVAAVRAVHVTVIVVMGVIMLVMIMVAVWAVNVGLLGHCSITLE